MKREIAHAGIYILKLSDARHQRLVDCLNNGEEFAEPVPEYRHRRNSPLLCLVVSPQNRITYIAKGKSGQRAGTEMRRINISSCITVTPSVDVEALADRVPNRQRAVALACLKAGGLLPSKTSGLVADGLSSFVPSLGTLLSRFGEERMKRLSDLSERTRNGLGYQKQAVASAITMAGISRECLLDWSPGNDLYPKSFLDGLPSARLREDSMIINDLCKLPGHEQVKTLPYSAAIFAGQNSRLTVILANRMPLEELTGTDLIYFNETYKSFVMVQYKAMECVRKSEPVFRLPNRQLSEEINRMEALGNELRKSSSCCDKSGFRLNENPFYIKLCPRIVFDPDDASLCSGMYVCLDYWKLLSEDSSTIGERGGKVITRTNLGRYLDNTEFVSLVSKAWIGTTTAQSEILAKLIRSTIESGRTVVIGIKTDI